MNIAKNCVVSINFKMTDGTGEVLDASDQGSPLIYLHGAVGVIPGLEKELEGKSTGDSFSVTIPPDEGFGESIPELVQPVPLSSFPDLSQIHVGAQLEGTDTSGESKTFVVREINDEHVMLDSNHPLAGMTLHIEGTVQEVREATDEEITQGHPL